MYKYVIAGCLALLLCACHSSGPSTDTTSGMASSQVAAAGSSGLVEDHPDEITPPRSAAELSAQMLDKVLASAARSAADRKLDALRHPKATLAFFGLRPDMSVLEVDPKTTWYAAILAPLLKQNGTFTVALVSPLGSKQAAATMGSLRKMFDAHPGLFGRARLASFDPYTPNLGTPGSADMVLSFRNAHTWVAQGTAKAMLGAIHEVLRPGGVFGMIENRAPGDASADDLKGTPYLRQDDVVKLAQQAGFKLDAASDINANPADEGVSDKAPADADRMTLRFIKPVKSKHAAHA